MSQPAHRPRPDPAPRRGRTTRRPRTLALPPSLRRRARAWGLRRAPTGAPIGAPSHAVLRAALRTLLALPPETPRDADRAVALIMRRVRADG